MGTSRRATLVCSLFVLLSSPSWAQTDADKATARTLAHEGVALKQAGKCEQALEKLMRAQQIYDAPTHLLLIGQCQVTLGRLVEGAETFRTLKRRKLEDDAPTAFRRAKEQATEELAAIEPRIPKVRISIVPPDVHGFEVRIDGTQVPAAVVGVDRLANPGHHVVEVSAPGYKAAQVQLQLSEGQVLPVEVKLERDGTPLAPPPAAGPNGTPPQPVPTPPPRTESEEDDGLELLLSVRLQTAFPGGDFGTITYRDTNTQTDQELNGGKVSDSFGPGGGLELQGALRFAENWAGALFFGVDGFGHVSSDDYGADLAVVYPGAQEFEAKESSAPYGGISGQWFSSPDDLGVFAEIGLAVRAWHQTVEYRPTATATETCSLEVTRSAPMLRMLIGLQVPVADGFMVTPFTSYSGGGVGTTRLKPTGDGECGGATTELSEASDDSAVYLLTVGAAGTLSFGL